MKNGNLIAIPDIHAPMHDKRALDLVCEVIADLHPTVVIQMGDLADNAPFSRHAKRFGEHRDPDKAIMGTRKVWSQIENVSMRSELHLLLGNHDHWLLNYVATNASAVEGLIPGYHGVYNMDTAVQVHDYQELFFVGKVAYVHDVGHAGKYATQQTLDAVGHCVVMGHTHRGQVVYSGATDGERWFGMSCGHLADVKHIKYMAPAKTREWQTGFGYVEYRDGYAFAQFIPIVKGRCVVNGKVYKNGSR